MTRKSIAALFNPWAARREQRERQLAELRQRDGDTCRRCRRAMRFDLPRGHQHAPTIEQILPASIGGTDELGNLCLCHTRCNRVFLDTSAKAKAHSRLSG